MTKLNAEPDFAIFPPFEAFYIESMLFSTCSAMGSAFQIDELFKIGNYSENKTEILFEFQNIFTHAGILSRYFKPARQLDIHNKRAEFLKKYFDVNEQNPLLDRNLRNALEHFDERLVCCPSTNDTLPPIV